jgi:hypothetical protein
MSVNVIDFAGFYYFPIIFWNCSDDTLAMPSHYLNSNPSKLNNEKTAILPMPHHYLNSNMSKPNNE